MAIDYGHRHKPLPAWVFVAFIVSIFGALRAADVLTTRGVVGWFCVTVAVITGGIIAMDFSEFIKTRPPS